MPTPLDPDGKPVPVGNLTLRTPGLGGTADLAPANIAGMRTAGLITPEFDEALSSEGLEPQQTVILRETREVRAPAGRSRSTSAGEPALQLDAPTPGDGRGQVLLAANESGVMTWSFAEPEETKTGSTRGAGRTRTYLVRRKVPSSPAPDSIASRGLIGAIGNKLLKVLAFKLIDAVAGEVGDYYAGRWEEKKRPYRVREFSPDDYALADAPLVDGERWRQLEGGRALLLVHGTFSRAHSGFGGLPAAFIEQMHQRYGGRVFAFDHHTLSEDPRANVDWLIRRIPEESQLELDVICHSRGGLVSRVLAERQAEIGLGSRTVKVRRVAFVATPNSGTLLADPKHFGDLVDTYTSLLNLFPDTGVLEVIQTVISVVKQIAVGALNGLDGLTAMCPDGDFLKALNIATAAEVDYFALASNYEAAAGGLKDFVVDRLADAIFKADNDLVVPTDGVYGANGSSLFPVRLFHSFAAADGIEHTRFFANTTAQAKLSEWLASPA